MLKKTLLYNFLMLFIYPAQTTILTSFCGTTISFLIGLPSMKRCTCSSAKTKISIASLDASIATVNLPLVCRRYAAHGGAFPLLLAGTGCVGSIGVSWAPPGRRPPIRGHCARALLRGHRRKPGLRQSQSRTGVLRATGARRRPTRCSQQLKRFTMNPLGASVVAVT